MTPFPNNYLFSSSLPDPYRKVSLHCFIFFKLWNTSKILKSTENFTCTHIHSLYRFITSSYSPCLEHMVTSANWSPEPPRLPPGTHSKRRKTEGHFLERTSWTLPPPPSKTLNCMSSHQSDGLKFATVYSWVDWWSFGALLDAWIKPFTAKELLLVSLYKTACFSRRQSLKHQSGV